MAFDVPVVAFDSSNVAYLLKNSGILIKDKKIPAITSLVKIIIEGNSLILF
jgi:hypothetical protein